MESSDCPLERLFRRISPQAPDDAADRILRGLAPDVVERRLYFAELECAAWTAVAVSAIGAIVAVTVLAVWLSRGQPIPGERPLALVDPTRELLFSFPAEGK